MDLNLEQAFEEPVDLSHRFEVSSDRLEREELLSLGPVSFEGRLQKADPGFVLVGRLQFEGTVACARCLAPVSFSKDGPVSWTFAPVHLRPKEKGPKGGGSRAKEGLPDVELTAEDLDVIYYGELTVPFDPLVEEQVQLELPMKALCREDCRGLCPTCGEDRNTNACSCAEPADGRWKALAALIPRS
jgi:uncharacterized protein